VEYNSPGERAYWSGASDIEAAAMDGDLLEPRWRRLLSLEADEEYVRIMRRIFEAEVAVRDDYRSSA
jgi:hypothetical protein